MSASWKKTSLEKLNHREIIALVLQPAILAQSMGLPVTVVNVAGGIAIEIEGWSMVDDELVPLVVTEPQPSAV